MYTYHRPLFLFIHTVGQGAATLLLISRRSCLRQGRRFVKRGIDSDGNTANFVETEQVGERTYRISQLSLSFSFLFSPFFLWIAILITLSSLNPYIHIYIYIMSLLKTIPLPLLLQMLINREGSLTSLVQIRGSIPLYWSSPANLKYTPKVHLEKTLLEVGRYVCT